VARRRSGGNFNHVHDHVSEPGYDGDTRRKSRIAITLAAVAGFVDAVGYITLYGLFTAHMSGNAAQLGVELGRGHLSEVVPLAVAIAMFVTAIALGALLQEAAGRREGAAGLELVLAVEALLIAGFMLYGSLAVSGARPERDSGAFYLLAALAIGAIGLQASSLSEVGGRGVRTAYISGVLTNLAREGVAKLRGTDRETGGGRLGLLAGIVAAYLLAATAGSLGQAELGLWCLALPVAALLVTAAGDLGGRLRGGGRR
jgi:uncharacterized membrane protein YoaK (UPF0700 family)